MRVIDSLSARSLSSVRDQCHQCLFDAISEASGSSSAALGTAASVILSSLTDRVSFCCYMGRWSVQHYCCTRQLSCHQCGSSVLSVIVTKSSCCAFQERRLFSPLVILTKDSCCRVVVGRQQIGWYCCYQAQLTCHPGETTGFYAIAAKDSCHIVQGSLILGQGWRGG